MLQFLVSSIVLSLALAAQSAIADIPDALRERQETLQQAFLSVRGAVVGVSDGLGVGSGVVVSGDGIVLTASHVVDSGRRRRIQPDSEVLVTFPDGAEYRARVLGKNRNADAAVLKIQGTAPDGKPFPHAIMGRSKDLRPGEWCFAMGNPGGMQEGRPAPLRIGRVLSAGDRTVVSDCSIVLGDSGGPLFDMKGQVIGIHSMITMLIIENRHVAIDCFHRDWDRFLAGERWGELRAFDSREAESGFFGVGLRWKDFVARISRIVPDGPADRAGLKPGDTLISIDGQRFADRLDLGTLLAELDNEKTVELVVLRDDKEQRLNLQTGIHENITEEDGERRATGDRSDRTEEDDERDEEIQEQMSSGRRIGPFEKRAPEQIKEFLPVVHSVRNSVVAIRDGGPIVCYGTVVSSDGYILTKASEIRTALDPECVLPDGRRFSPREVGSDDAYDLALLKVDATDLQPAEWHMGDDVPAGTLTIVPDARGNPLIPAVISVGSRKMANSAKGFLGVALRQEGNRVFIEEVIRGGAAARHKFQPDDEIISIDGITIRAVSQMIEKISGYQPGEKIMIRFRRKSEERSVELILTPRFTNQDAMLPLYQSREFQGQFVSTHSGGYPRVLQHDADIFPNQCGGPLVGLDGKMVGINIARADRVVSYAIPAETAREIFDRLRASDSGRELKTSANP